jgi:cobalt-zinc-cadmium efflux system protein
MTHAHDHHDHDHPGHEHAGHDRHHHGGLGHVHPPANFGKAFAIAVPLNAGFVVLEVVYGVLGHSVALLADAVP